MNKRQAKKASKKVTFPFADEMNLLTLSPEEHKAAMEDFHNYVQKYCRYKHYKDRYKKPAHLGYHFPIGQSYKEQMARIMKTTRRYDCDVKTIIQRINDLKNMYPDK